MLAPGAMRTSLVEIVSAFEQSTGHKMTVEYGSAIALAGRVQKGEQADVVILTRNNLDAFANQGLLRVTGEPDVARSGIGVMVRKG